MNEEGGILKVEVPAPSDKQPSSVSATFLQLIACMPWGKGLTLMPRLTIKESAVLPDAE